MNELLMKILCSSHIVTTTDSTSRRCREVHSMECSASHIYDQILGLLSETDVEVLSVLVFMVIHQQQLITGVLLSATAKSKMDKPHTYSHTYAHLH